MYNGPYHTDGLFGYEKHAEMKSYFRSEYKNDHEWAFLNWLETAKTKKKKILSPVYLASLVACFLPRNKD